MSIYPDPFGSKTYPRLALPGTPSFSNIEVKPGSSTSTTLIAYYTVWAIDTWSETTLAELTITLTKRSVVIAIASSFGNAEAGGWIKHRLYIGGAKVFESDPDEARVKLRVFRAYRVLEPGTYTISYRLFNEDWYNVHNFYIYSDGTDRPGLRLEVIVVPLEF